MKTRDAFVGIVTGAALVACAAGERKTASSPPPASEAAPAQQPYPSSPGGAAPQTAAPAPPPPPPSPAGDAAPTQPSTPPAAGAYAQPPNRAAALSQATTEIEASQRELDVAGGDCRNACRALGSMDRAAGRICGLAQSNDELRRCTDAKTRVYSARDKVKSTCGTCPDTSVDRNAPIPSR